MPVLLEAERIDVAFGQVQILHDASVSLNEGERIGLFGPNGHGKTTLLETISGLHRPRHGVVRFDGEEIQGLPPRAIVERGLVHVPQGNTLFPRMTVQENLYLGGFNKRVWKQRRGRIELVYEVFPRLRERRDQLCRTLSGGERQMLAVGAGLMADARVLMLDEPTLGLAPKLKDELREAIGRIAKSGVPMVIVEQDVEFLLGLADRLYLIQDGRVALETSRDDHDLDHAKILDMYFGGFAAGSATSNDGSEEGHTS
jgi:branched-chain amino acid transport system ATP-binding protein